MDDAAGAVHAASVPYGRLKKLGIMDSQKRYILVGYTEVVNSNLRLAIITLVDFIQACNKVTLGKHSETSLQQPRTVKGSIKNIQDDQIVWPDGKPTKPGLPRGQKVSTKLQKLNHLSRQTQHWTNIDELVRTSKFTWMINNIT